MGNKATDHAGRLKGGVEEVVGTRKPISVPLGNEVALNVGKGGPGTGRDCHATGSQGVHGSVNPGQPRAGANRSIFPGFK
jgi:hypothetical protein